MVRAAKASTPTTRVPFRRVWRWDTELAANTAIIYFGNQSFKDMYTAESIRYMRHNSSGVRFTNFATPEVLFAEQRLLLLCLHAHGGVAAPFLDAVWKPKQGQFVRHDPAHGPWAFAALDPSQIFTHAWIHKWHLCDNEATRTDYCRSLSSILAAEFPDRVPQLQNIAAFARYAPASAAHKSLRCR